MMKLGFSSWAMPKLPVANQIALVRDAGYASIELVSGMGGTLNARTATAEERREIRRLLDEAQLDLPSIAGHANPFDGDAEKKAEAVETIHAGIDLAADLAGPNGPPCLVTMAWGKPDEYEARREAVADGMADLARYAERRGVVLALEPHVGQSFDRPERVLWLMERVNLPHFRLNFDNSHFEVMGYDLDTYVAPLTPYAVHTHLKDQRGRSADAFEFLVPGEGEFDYARYLRAMEAAGYNGSVTVEISVAVQKRPDYDAAEVIARSFKTLTDASKTAGVPLTLGRALVGA